MPDFEKKFIYILPFLLIMLVPLVFMPAVSLSSAVDYINFAFSDKSTMQLTLTTIDPRIRSLSSDPENQLVMKLEIKDKEGRPVSGAGFRITTTDQDGTVTPSSGRTGSDGSCLVTYRPSIQPDSAYIDGKAQVSLTAVISDSDIAAALSFELVHIPVVFIHGYKTPPTIFDSFAAYLESKGFTTASLNYDSDKGVAFGAAQLRQLLEEETKAYLEKGIQVKRFDLIGHSMGGLVARYYTCSRDYISSHDVEKIIFVSVPQNGSSLAALGLKYYSDRGIFDLIPDSDLFTNALPNMINQGLNDSIQAGSILGQYDEVVSAESASLDEWGIKTELFNVGENNFTVDKLLSGEIVEAANHKAVLYNKKIFNRVEEMLVTQLAYPIKK